MRNYYDILGIGRDATQSEIKAAYRKLAKKYHPDSSSGSEEDKARFQEIQEAYSVLSDPEKRKQYHYYGHDAYRSSYHAQHSSAPGQENSQAMDGHCGGCEAGRRPKQTEEECPPQAVRIAVWLELEETLREVEKDAYYTERIPNPDPLSKLKFIEKNWKFRVKIPSDSFDRQFYMLESVLCEETDFLKVQAERNPDKIFAVIILLRDKPGFIRQGYHLYTDLTVDYHTLVLGGPVKIPTLTGEQLYDIPAGTTAEQKLRLPGQGLIQPKKAGGRGDIYVRLHIRIPQELTIPQLSAMLKLREAMEAEDYQ